MYVKFTQVLYLNFKELLIGYQTVMTYICKQDHQQTIGCVCVFVLVVLNDVHLGHKIKTIFYSGVLRTN